MKNSLEKFNLFWSEKANHTFTEEEYQEELKQDPDLWQSYSRMEQIAKKYKNDKIQR